MNPAPRIVIFDIDGTLVDAFQAVVDSVNWMLNEMGYPPQPFLKIKRAVGWGVDTLVNNFIPAHQAEKALELFREHHNKRLRSNLRLLPGARKTLSFLKKKGCRLAIASNRPTKFSKIILDVLDIAKYFDWVICGDAVENPKPAPDVLQAILKEARMTPVEALYVGDMTVDVECAERAGVKSVAIPTGSCTRKQLMEVKPDFFIERLSQLNQFFPCEKGGDS